MGCQHSKPPVAPTRRRLSLGFVDPSHLPPGGSSTTGDSTTGATEKNRSLLLEVHSKTLQQILEGEQGRRQSWSASSSTDLRRQSFSQKTVEELGHPIEQAARDNLGFVCKKGLKPEAPNQDSFLVVKAGQDLSIYGVFDGHGPFGHDVSEFVKNALPKVLVLNPILITQPDVALRSAFEQTQRLLEEATEIGHLNAQFSGTTATVVVHLISKGEIWTAHVGDSRAVLGRRMTLGALDASDAGGAANATASNRTQTAKIDYLMSRSLSWLSASQQPPSSAGAGAGGSEKDDNTSSNSKSGLYAVDLTQDHKPDDPAERERIENSGGRVIFDGFYNYRVYAKKGRYPGLNMSRALGDLAGYYDAGISPVPTISFEKLRKKSKEPSGLSTAGSKNHTGSPRHMSETTAVVPTFAGGGALPGSITSSTNSSTVKAGQRGDKGEQESQLTTDEFLLLCSDGVWEFMSSQECVEFVETHMKRGIPDAAEVMAKECYDRWTVRMLGQVVDDITAVIVKL
ncbi:unnamed protein product [Amoebophrya sp. A120]|nr:unnamed protein product [Amoebophrya sp. A120]|eukprot:GSA120T00003053001.1